MEKKQTHYRKVMKSDHLGSADVEEFIEEKKSLIFTIKHVKQEYNVTVAGRKGNFNIAYFKEAIKPLVLNATNAKTVRSFVKDRSPFVENWNDIVVKLYIDHSVKMKGEIVGGVRIEKVQPKTTKQKFEKSHFEKAKEQNATIESIKVNWDVSAEIEKSYKEYVK